MSPRQPTTGEASLEARFDRHLSSLLSGGGRDPLRLLVALSGGLDSVVLLHLLRFRAPSIAFSLAAAHFDHRMRDGSAADAEWVEGLCRAWEIPLETGAAERPLRSEEGARDARYSFLWSAVERQGAQHLLTAHHADDQAETVLFRILRGTGLAGLRGIPARSGSGLVRPLLPFWREELEAHARANKLRWRTDPTNESQGPARNRIRNALLPEVERSIAPAARRNLVALAGLARESEAGWRAQVEEAEDSLVRFDKGAALVAREGLRRYHPALATRVLRKVLGRFGMVPDRIGTRSALQFITDASSGREMQLPGGLRLRTEFDVVRIDRTDDEPGDEDRSLEIDRPEAGEPRTDPLRLGGRTYRVDVEVLAGTPGERPLEPGWSVRLPLDALRFPLRLRGRRPGDRLRTAAGTRSLKRLMIDRGVPRSMRASLPVLEDARGDVLWVAGLASARLPQSDQGEWVLHLAVHDD